VDSRDFLQSLSAAERRELTQKSDLIGLKHLAVHAAAILIVSYLILEGVLLWQLLLIVQGILLVFLFTLMHESIHRTAFATGAINDWVARICSVILVLPAEWFRHFHFTHHRHTQDPLKDPELATPKPQTILQYLWHVSGVPIWLSAIRTLCRNAAGGCDDKFVSDSQCATVQFEARALLLIYAAIALLCFYFKVSSVIWIWILPLVLGQPFLRLYLLAEHGHCALVANAFENSRTTYTNRVVRALAWNMPYHSEHHVYPSVPFHRLEKLHQRMRQYLMETESGYIRFNSKYLKDIDSEK